MQANQAERQRWNDEYWTTAWPKRERFTNMATPVLLDALQLKPGERVLDVGSGGGLAAIAAAGKTGDGGAVVGADISVPLAALASRRAGEAGTSTVSFTVADVQTDRIPGGPFDAAMSQFGVMFFDEPAVAFANIRAHLAPEGRLAFACWQAVEKNAWFFGVALKGIVPPPPEPAPGKSPTGPFTLAEAGRIHEILEDAGFTGVSIRPHQITIQVPEDTIVDDAQLRFIGVPEEMMSTARTAIDRHLAPSRLSNGECRFTPAFQIVTARNSGR